MAAAKPDWAGVHPLRRSSTINTRPAAAKIRAACHGELYKGGEFPPSEPRGDSPLFVSGEVGRVPGLGSAISGAAAKSRCSAFLSGRVAGAVKSRYVVVSWISQILQERDRLAFMRASREDRTMSPHSSGKLSTLQSALVPLQSAATAQVAKTLQITTQRTAVRAPDSRKLRETALRQTAFTGSSEQLGFECRRAQSPIRARPIP